MYKVNFGEGRELTYKNESSLLDTLESHAIQAEYSCRAGFCGVCKVHLLAGKVKYVQDPIISLSGDEILSCCCIPDSDISVDLDRRM